MSDLLTPDAWCDRYGLDILDPDGWRGRDAPPWDEPLPLPEFWRRFTECTVRGVPADTHARIMAELAEARREPTCSVCGNPAEVMLTSESDDEPICEGCYCKAARGHLGPGVGPDGDER